jgi:hypothetical protein
VRQGKNLRETDRQPMAATFRRRRIMKEEKKKIFETERKQCWPRRKWKKKKKRNFNGAREVRKVMVVLSLYTLKLL